MTHFTYSRTQGPPIWLYLSQRSLLTSDDILRIAACDEEQNENRRLSDRIGMLCVQCLNVEGECSPTVCRAPECTFCTSFAELNAQISKARLNLADLSRKRSELKTQINYYHIPYINRLPFELISKIFIDIVQENRSVDPLERCYFGDFSIPPRLGAVCKMWREVTLATPQLWTTVNFRVQFCACQSPDKIDVARDWFSRSHSLPLTINIAFMDCKIKKCRLKYIKNCDLDSPVDLLRSHSTRWSRIHIDNSSSHSELLHKLLENLPNQPTDLEFLSLGSSSDKPETFDKKRVLLEPRSIYQCASLFDSVGLWDIPCSLERLTHMEMDTVPIDEVFYFFENAPNLQHCRILFNNDTDLDDSDEMFPLPTTPMMAQHLTYLRTGPSIHDFFSFLILPSLQTLDFVSYDVGNEHDLEDLITCLKQSRPPLQTFKLTVSLDSPDFHDWYELLPDITSLSVNMPMPNLRHRPDESPTRCTMTEDFLAALASPSGTLALPKLQSLRLNTRGMSDASWTSLCDIFKTGSPDRLNLLKEIHIYHAESKWERNFAMEARVFGFFEVLKDAGVQLEVKFNSFGPEFGSSVATAS